MMRSPGADPMAGRRLPVVRYGPAKLNLTLAVLGRRVDGYHSLHSVVVPLALRDALTIAAAPAGASQDSLRISGIALPVEPDNLVLRAIAATRAAVLGNGRGLASAAPFLAARLSKRIPVAAGLGGGSSDAAAAMDAALALWNATLTSQQAMAVAASLGSDVPFFLTHGPALVRGRGELVEPLAQILGEPPAVLLVTPKAAISTAAVFAAFDAGTPLAPLAPPIQTARFATAALVVSDNLATAVRSGLTVPELLELARDLAEANDLLGAAQSVAPWLAGFRATLADLLARPVGQSGSGPTLWALFPSLPQARQAARLVRQGSAKGVFPAIGAGQPFVAVTSFAPVPATRP